MPPRTCPRCRELLRECICEPDDDRPAAFKVPFIEPPDPS